MPRDADKIFLRLAVTSGYLTEEDADGVWGELVRLEREGEPTKARTLCVELGFVDAALAKRLKNEVRASLEQRARAESQGSQQERRLAGFELLEKISAGAMGTVYKARHLRLDKVVALKLLNPDFKDDQSYVALFLQEARAAASLNHPNIVQAYDVGQTGDVHYIAMEYVEGKTVKELIERRGRLDEPAAIEIVLQVTAALQHAHESNLVHRDVKPANIMITKDGQAKLLDLGLVRRTDTDNELTAEGKAIGTPYYMAPEQALDRGADYRADIYALGATLFNMVTGEKPYVASTPVAVMNMHLKAPIPDACALNPKVSKGLSQVIAKMLAKRPGDRYQSHADLVADLTGLLHGFMPELKTGDAPAGMGVIRRSGTGSQVYLDARRAVGAAAAGGSPSNRAVLASLAAAAVLLVGTGLYLLRGRAEMGALAKGPPAPAQREEPALGQPGGQLEENARRIYGDLPPGETPARLSLLEDLARRYPGTTSGRRAEGEVRALRLTLERREREAFRGQQRELDALAERGRLREAAEGYQQLAARTQDADLRRQAEVRAQELLGVVARRVAEAEERARGLSAAGREREAAGLLRDSAPLQSEKEREAALARAKALESTAARREDEERRRSEQVASQQAGAEEARVQKLPADLRLLVKNGLLADALALARETAAAIKTPALQRRAQAHADAVRAAAELEDLALEGLARRKGDSISLERRKGTRLLGTLKGVVDGRVVVGLEGDAETSLAPRDLAEAEVWKAVARLLGPKHPRYLRGVTALRLYRGETALDAELQRCEQAGVDLSLVAAELRALEPQPVAKADPAKGPKDGKGPKRPRPDDPQDAYRRAGARNEAAWRMIEARTRLFVEADRIGYAGEQLEPIYDFARGQSFGSEWQLLAGRAFPNPSGRRDRYGLVLEGREGRAEFAPPLEGNLAVSVNFMCHSFGRRASRFALTLDAKEQKTRLSTELGQLVLFVKGRPRKGQGEVQAQALQLGNVQTLELHLQGKKVWTKLNGKEVARLELDDELQKMKLGLEWGNVGMNLVSITTMCTPTPEWVEAKLK